VITVKTLKNFFSKEKHAEQALLSWYQEATLANWANHNELKQQFAHASIISTKRVVFNIHGNTFRLIVDIEYSLQIIFVVWIGTHKAYDKIDEKTINFDKAN